MIESIVRLFIRYVSESVFPPKDVFVEETNVKEESGSDSDEDSSRHLSGSAHTLTMIKM